MDVKERRAVLVRAKARQFAASVRGCPGMAFTIPDEIIDWLEDSEIQDFFAACRSFRIMQREDRKWEATL